MPAFGRHARLPGELQACLHRYIEEWIVDIGDKVKKGDVKRIELTLKLVDVAAADVEAAQARLDETEAILDDYQAQVDALEMYVKRCWSLVEGNQDDSRKAARYGFVKSQAVAQAPDQFVKRYLIRRALKRIIESIRQPF